MYKMTNKIYLLSTKNFIVLKAKNTLQFDFD